VSRWLLLTQDFPPVFCGGIASWAADLAGALAAQGEAVEVYARRSGNTREFDAAFPATVHRMWGRSWSRWQGTWVRCAVGRKLVAGDRVLAATWRVATGLLGAIRARSAQLAVAFHGSDLTQLDVAPPGLRAVVDSADALLPVSGFLASELVRLNVVAPDDPRMQVLPMPVEAGPAGPGGDGLVCVARPTPLKGIDRAVALAQALGRTITLVGPTEPTGPGVNALGRRTRAETRSAIAEAAAIVLLPEVDAHGRGAEGLGLALIEAATMGIPAIGCQTGGVPEAVGPGLVLADPDAPDLAVVRAFLADEDAGARARAWAQAHHGAERALRTLREVLGCA
jgi:glycosyltransferase involved in cell wall biosynthesis